MIVYMCYAPRVKTYIHARLGKQDHVLLRELRESTGESDSELVRRGLRVMSEQLGRRPSALDVAGNSAGKFSTGPADLSTNDAYLDDFGR